jgi:two-component system, sensor histidine kinase LadS
VLPIQVAPGGHYELYLRVASRMGAMLVPVELESARDLEHSQRASLLINGILSGAFAGLFLYNLLLYASLRERAYLFYVLLLPATYLACTVLDGFGPWMLYPSWVWPSNQGLALFAGTSFALSMLFARALLETSTIQWLDRLLLAVAAVATGIAACCALLPGAVLYRLIALLVLVAPICAALAGVIALRRAHPQARFYVLAQAATWGGMCGFVLSAAGVIGFSQLTRQGVSFGITVNALLLSLALADRIRALRQCTQRAESSARQELERRQQELERTVAARTQELEQARRHAEFLATTDALTGIYNRRGLLPLVQQAIDQAKAAGTPLALICFDLDYFKHINDDFGHAEGDRVLCDLVAHTRKHVRQSDLLGRTGGEEFMLALGAPLPSAVQRAEELRARLQQELRAGSGQRPVTASFGVAALGPMFHSLETLQQAADAALYRAKRRGRNRVEIYSENDEATLRTRAIVCVRRRR